MLATPAGGVQSSAPSELDLTDESGVEGRSSLVADIEPQ